MLLSFLLHGVGVRFRSCPGYAGVIGLFSNPFRYPIGYECEASSRGLQVLIAYGRPLSSHTALRLILSKKMMSCSGILPEIMEGLMKPCRSSMDPFPLPVSRPGDILVGQTPDLRTYAQFRWALEGFEPRGL